MSDDESHLLLGDWQVHPCIWSLDNLSRISWNTAREAYDMQGELSKTCNLQNARLIKSSSDTKVLTCATNPICGRIRTEYDHTDADYHIYSRSMILRLI